ncbi:MAG: hypothetical protein E7379_04585 [Clostridiales bacterium]|nr:hypothetical protein [Clostridiales bacterium]
MKLNKIFGIEEYDEAYKFANENNYLIEEIASAGQRRIFKLVEKKEPSEEEKVDSLRSRREFECFSIVNRGELWYESLTVEKYLQLKKWYQDWLDVTESKVVPEKPDWII